MPVVGEQQQTRYTDHLSFVDKTLLSNWISLFPLCPFCALLCKPSN